MALELIYVSLFPRERFDERAKEVSKRERKRERESV